MPPFYTAFHMLNPAPIADFHASEYTRPWQVAALIEALDSHHVSMLVLRRTHDFLWAAGSPSDHLEPLRIYVSQNYRMTKTFPTGDEVWLQNSSSRCYLRTIDVTHQQRQRLRYVNPSAQRYAWSVKRN